MTNIEKTYDPTLIEKHWYDFWEKQGFFSPSDKGEPYCIVLPPPNVTGSLHMGHGFLFTLMDVMIRYQRMQGKNTLWQTGTDHAGISTQMVVERNLNLENKTRHELGREAFVKKIWEWKEQSGGTITKQLRRLGASMDWNRERFTLDEDLSYAVREVFIKLYEEGLIYRGKRLVNWDPVLLTAISDLEVTNEEEEGHLWYIKYPVANSNDYIIVATTRPETMLGDVAIAVNPSDERYQHLAEKQISLPLTNRTIPVIFDDYVDKTFGTGCVKITPAHDFNDYAIGIRHQLPIINIFDPHAHLNENVPKKYQGMERFKARKLIVEDLTQLGAIEKIEKHKLKIPRGDRTNAVIEPYLTHQWYVKSKPLAEPAIEAVSSGKIKFIPENWDKTYFQWMNNIEDWCISRQIWWGHRIPVWYDNEGNTYVGHNESDVRKKYDLEKDAQLKQDEDVLDTWFSSALWPFSSLGWPKKTEELKLFFPNNVLMTGFDIIFFWVARMIMMSLKFTDQIPFKEVYITGLIRDAEGHKMSKSKGNVIDPIDLIDGISLDNLIQKRTYGLMQPNMQQKIEKSTRKEFPHGIPSYGTDALRFTFCSFASYTREIRFDVNRLAGYRNFCNKIWNASRYVLMNTENFEFKTKPNIIDLADRFILSRLQNTIKLAHTALNEYRFDHLSHTLYDFTWNEFCDWYIELSKPLLTESQPELQYATRYTLLHVLEQLLRLLHPIMPFITEEIWQRVAPLIHNDCKSIMICQYPEENFDLVDEQSEKDIQWLKNIIIAIRTIRSEMNIAPGKPLNVFFKRGSAIDKNNDAQLRKLLINLAKIASIKWLAEKESTPPSASAFVGELEIYIPLSDFINKDEEIKRITKEINKIQSDIEIVKNKLNNPAFSEKAPSVIVEKEKSKYNELNMTLTKLNKQLTDLQH